MQKLVKRTFLMLLTMVLTVVAPLLAWAAQHDIIILHTNDIHCGINDNLGFAKVAQLKKDLLKENPNVVLVDAGDAIQGAPIGKLSKGQAVINIMNAVGYDFCITGNHEFDYGMDRFLELASLQKAGYYNANFISKKTGKAVLPAYKIMEFEGTKVAFIGSSTPETLTSSTPIYFQNSKGEYIYGFCEDNTGEKLYKQLQKTVNKARKEGADYVVLVCHLGMDGAMPIWKSETVAKNTVGIDAIIDGHSHEMYNRIIQNKVGDEVVLAQTGTKLKSVGKLVIAPDGSISSTLVKNVEGEDAAVKEVISREIATYEPLLKQPVGETKIQLHSYDPQTGERLVRKQECALGDFVCDAYKAVLDCDVVVVNGGSVRNEIVPGVISYNAILEAFPFGNMCTVVEVPGQAILDCLELGAMSYPEENGGFMQVAGLSYTVNSAIPSSIELNDKGEFIAVNGAYRVENVLVNGEPLDLNKKYTVGGTSYILKDGGNGMTMFKGAKLVQDAVVSDADAILEYIQNHLNGQIGDEYANPYGLGRITIK